MKGPAIQQISFHPFWAARPLAGALFACFSLLGAALPSPLYTEPLRLPIVAAPVITPENPAGVNLSLSVSDAVIISLGGEIRFFRGLEIEFTVPQSFLPWRGSLALALYRSLNRVPSVGIADLDARQYSFDPVPNKITSVFQIPMRQRHGLRTTPYVQVHGAVLLPASFPLLFQLAPIIKGLSEDLENMRFGLVIRPILGDEGLVRIIPRYPESLPDRPFTVLIDDTVVERIGEEQLLREGEHHLMILSNDYRNESRAFMVERGRTIPLTLQLQDTTPLVIFEAPDNARIFFDGQPVTASGSMPASPGAHEVRYQLSDYTIIRSLTVQRGKTYRVSLNVDLNIEESD